MMDPEDLVDLHDRDKDADQDYGPAVDEKLALLVLGVSGGMFGRVLRNAKIFSRPPLPPPVVSAPSVVSASAKAAQGAARVPRPPASPVVELNPINAIDEAVKKVETPVFLPARVAKIYNELIKIASHGGVAAFLLDKYADVGCSETCPFLGNGEYRLPAKKPTVVEEDTSVSAPSAPSVVEKVPAVPAHEKPPGPAADEKEPVVPENTVPVQEKPAGSAVSLKELAVPEITVPVDKKRAEAVEKLAQHTPCFYPDMRAQTDDLLFKGYNTGLKLVLDCSTDVMRPDGKRQANISFDASTDNKDINFRIDCTMNPGFKGVLSWKNPSKVILRYRKPLAAGTISVRSGIDAGPVVSLSGVLGTNNIAFGAEVSVDTRSLTLSKYSRGLYLSKGEASAALIMENDDALLGSYHHKLDGTTSIGADLVHTLSSKQSSLTVGCSHDIDSSTSVKGKLSSDGKLCVVLKRTLKPKCYVSVSAESDFNFRGSGSGTKFGLCIALTA